LVIELRSVYKSSPDAANFTQKRNKEFSCTDVVIKRIVQ